MIRCQPWDKKRSLGGKLKRRRTSLNGTQGLPEARSRIQIKVINTRRDRGSPQVVSLEAVSLDRILVYPPAFEIVE